MIVPVRTNVASPIVSISRVDDWRAGVCHVPPTTSNAGSATSCRGEVGSFEVEMTH